MATKHEGLWERYSGEAKMHAHENAWFYFEVYGLDEDNANSHPSNENSLPTNKEDTTKEVPFYEESQRIR